MRAPRLLLQRARAQRGTLLTLLVLTATVAAILPGSIGYTRAAGVATVRDTLTEAPARDAGIQVQTRLAGDPAAQDAALRATVSELLGADVAVSRALWTEAVTAEAGGEAVRVVLAEAPGPAGSITLDGAPPAPGEVLVPEQTAADAGLTPGTRLTAGEAALTVSGTWQATDERAWFADPMVAAGTDGSALGPLLTDAATIADVVTAPFVRWTGYPDPAALTVADLTDLAAGLAALDYALGDGDAVAVRGLTVTGGLAETVADLEAATSTAAAVGLVPVALLAIISLVALVQVVRLLGQTRAREIEILVARGAAAPQVTVWSAVEIAAVAVIGAALGTVMAAVVVGRLDGGADQRQIIVATGVAVAVVAVVGGTVVAGLQARTLARRLVADRSGRLQGAATVGAVVLAGVAAVLSAWQLLRHGTPLIDDDGATRADVLAVVSLGAVLGALALLALAVLGPLTRLVAAARARERWLVGVLAARQVSRRVRAYAVPLVLVVLAAGATSSAAAFAGATTTQGEHVAALATGSDVRVTVPIGGTSRLAQPQAVSALPYRELPGVAAAGVVMRGGGSFGDLPVAVTALDGRRAADVMQVPERLSVIAAARDLAADRLGIALAAGAQELELTVRVHLAYDDEAVAEAERAAGDSRGFLLDQGITEADAEEILADEQARLLAGEFELETAAWVTDGDGGLSMLTAAPLSADPAGGDALVGPEPSEHTLRLPLPTADEYRLVALDLGLSGPLIGSEVSYEVVSVAAGGEEVALAGAEWQPVDVLDTADVDPLGTIGVRGRLGALAEPDAELRLMPGGLPAAVPAVISGQLAATADLAVGDPATVSLSGAGIALEVADVVDAVPGGLEEQAVLVDLAALGSHVLSTQPNPLLPGQVWIAVADDAADVAAAAGDLAGREASVEVAGEGATDSAASVRETFWIAAAGAVLLALTGVAAVALALARERRSEVMVLRALGLPPAGQARTRVAELLGVGGLGVVLGLLAGWAASALLVPTLARAAATQSSPLPLGNRFDLLPALGALAVLAAGLLVVAAVVATRVRAQALDAEYREEVR